jgi:hypothetical protein
MTADPMTNAAQLAAYRRGTLARQARAQARWQAVADLARASGLATEGRGALLRLFYHVATQAPALLLVRKLPKGTTFDSVPLLWLRQHSISVRCFRRGFRSWQRRTARSAEGVA